MTASSAVGDALREAVRGRFPPPDGAAGVVPTWRAGTEAVVALTGHALVCVNAGREVRAERVLAATAATYPPGFGGATDPRTVVELAGPGAWIDSLDVLLGGVARPGGATDLVEVAVAAHPRVDLARALRDGTRVYAADGVLVTVSTGIGGLHEMSVEVEQERRGTGLARRAAASALALVPAGEPVLAAVSPGNAASLRAFLAAGLAPLGSVQLWRPATAP